VSGDSAKSGSLFQNFPKGATANAQMYSLVETAKVNGQEPYMWLRHVLDRLPLAQSVADYEALLPGTAHRRCHGKPRSYLLVGVVRGSFT
jgi:hypothetical protein